MRLVAVAPNDLALVDDGTGGPVGVPREGYEVVDAVDLDGLEGIEMLGCSRDGLDVADGERDCCCPDHEKSVPGVGLDATESRVERRLALVKVPIKHPFLSGAAA